MALRVRGETVEEITGAVTAMRAKMLRVKAPANAIDIVGTGGDGSGSYNVSTLAALIAAACGVPVAKHGNRAASSKSGAADALGALGVKIGLPPEGVERCIAEAGIGFMMAPTHHAAMRHVGPARVELGTRTIFNLLGPLSNPAGVKRQLIGVFSSAWLQADGRGAAQSRLRARLDRPWRRRARRDHDDRRRPKSSNCTTARSALSRSRPRTSGCDAPTPPNSRAAIPRITRRRLREVLEGERNAYRDIAVFNAAAALVVADAARDLAEGVAQSASTRSTAAPRARLSNGLSPSQMRDRVRP